MAAPAGALQVCAARTGRAAQDGFLSSNRRLAARASAQLGGRTVEPGPAAERGIFPVGTDQGTLGGAPFGAAELAGSPVERPHVSGLAGKVGMRGLRFSSIRRRA